MLELSFNHLLFKYLLFTIQPFNHLTIQPFNLAVQSSNINLFIIRQYTIYRRIWLRIRLF
ncbi:MAG TPA: hypothetical protein DCL77_09710 [Prolixibacteraceae bacterium]|nr:hypothetical protein [Prolixibacteraceae bacterium]